MKQRTLIMRAAALLFVTALSALLFVRGKGHTVYLDTGAITVNGEELRAPELSSITVDGLPPEEMGRAERAQISLVGPKHRIIIESLGMDGKVYERSFSIPISMSSVILSVPAVMAGLSEAEILRPFVYGE